MQKNSRVIAILFIVLASILISAGLIYLNTNPNKGELLQMSDNETLCFKDSDCTSKCGDEKDNIYCTHDLGKKVVNKYYLEKHGSDYQCGGPIPLIPCAQSKIVCRENQCTVELQR